MKPVEKSFAVLTDGLSKSYGNVHALRGLDLRVPEKSIFGLLGPNGAGKTTTIKLLLGLLRPTSGGGTLLGQDILQNSVEARRRIGYLAQNPSYYSYMTAREVLRFKLRFYSRGERKEMEDRVEETLQMVGLQDKADRPISGFSGGERQRLGIAQAEVHRPELLILDEPAANLDPMGRHDVLNLMEKLREHSTVVYSTHILNDVQHISDTVAILKDGNLLAQAPIDALLNGSGGVVYNLTLKGPYQRVYDRIHNMPWVTGVNVVHSDPRTTLEVSVTDEGKAEAELPRLALQERDSVVSEFGKKRFELEDVFLDIVRGAPVGA